MCKINIQIRTILLVILCGALLGSCKSNPKKEYTAQEMRNFQENLIKANRGLVTKDQDDIANFISKKGWNMKKTETGLWYEIIQFNKGKKALLGKVAHLKYTLSLLDGTLCYTSDSLGVKSFKIGQGGVESGLEEGVLLLSEGDIARFIMPPHLAYGLLGDENKIPSRCTIVYNVELLKLTD